MSRQNLLILITDQQSATMLSATGNPHVRTPNLDLLAGRSFRFEGAYCSNPMCVPSRFSMMTGRPASEIGLHRDGASVREPVSDEILASAMGYLARQAGADAFFGGKEHFPKSMRAETAGFSLFESDQRQRLAEQTAVQLIELGSAPRENPFLLVSNLINPHDICYMGLRDYAANDFEKMLVERGEVACAELDRALALPEGMDESEFFSQVCPPLPDNYEPQQDEPEAIDHELTRRPFRRSCREHWTEREWRLHRWAYARLTEKVDAEIGLILDGLEKSGLADETAIIFTSDHGDMDAAHRLEHKDVLYEEACRIPLLLHLPGMTEGQVVDRRWLANTGLDLVPTVCDWFGSQAPEHCQGTSLLQSARDPLAVREVIPIESEIGHATIGARYKRCVYFHGHPAEQWFDRETEPGEMRSCPASSIPEAQREQLVQAHRAFGLYERPCPPHPSGSTPAHSS